MAYDSLIHIPWSAGSKRGYDEADSRTDWSSQEPDDQVDQYCKRQPTEATVTMLNLANFILRVVRDAANIYPCVPQCLTRFLGCRYAEAIHGSVRPSPKRCHYISSGRQHIGMVLHRRPAFQLIIRYSLTFSHCVLKMNIA